MKYKYLCVVSVHKDVQTVLSCHEELAIYSEDIASVKDGFWVNEEGRLTNGDDCFIWIPPSKIQYIAKNRGYRED